MNIYLIKWPDGSASLIEAYDETDLYMRMDREADPNSAIVKKIVGNAPIHLTFNIAKQNNEEFIDVDLDQDCDDVKLHKFTFKKDMFYKYIARITNRTVKQIKNLPQNKIQEIKNGMGLE